MQARFCWRWPARRTRVLPFRVVKCPAQCNEELGRCVRARAHGRAEQRPRTAALLGAISLVVLVAAGHVAMRPPQTQLLSQGSQKELERLERDTFESPDRTYNKMLSQLRHTKVSQGAALETADAWASAAWPQPQLAGAAAAAAAPRSAALPDLEHRIAADVSKSLAKTVAREVAKAMASSHQAPLSRQQRRAQQQQQQQARLRQEQQQKRAKAQAKLLTEVQQQVAADATKLDRDQNLLHWVTGRLGTAPAGSSKLVRNKLMHTFTEPVSSAEPSHNADLPFNEPEATSESGPSDTYNYWYGDHYHDEEGPDGVAVAGVEVDGSRPAEAEAPWLVDHARDKLEAQGVNVRTPYGSTKAVSFETKQEAQGKKDPWGKEGVLNADNNADLDDEQPLNEAGVVTDRMPGFGPKKMYKKAFPIPFYDHEATTEEANEALDQGHRVVAANGEHMQKDLGITLNQPNLLVYGHADTHSPHLDAAQAAYPMVDGLGDKMESKVCSCVFSCMIELCSLVSLSLSLSLARARSLSRALRV